MISSTERSISKLLLSFGSSKSPEGAETLTKVRGVCVDDGMEFENPLERIVSLSPWVIVFSVGMSFQNPELARMGVAGLAGFTVGLFGLAIARRR